MRTVCFPVLRKGAVSQELRGHSAGNVFVCLGSSATSGHGGELLRVDDTSCDLGSIWLYNEDFRSTEPKMRLAKRPTS